MAVIPIGVWLVTVDFPSIDGVAKDAVQWKFVLNPTVPQDQVDLQNMLAAFWNTPPSGPGIGGTAMHSYLANGLSRVAGALIFRWYNVTDSLHSGVSHGTPVFIGTGGLTTGTLSPTDMPATNALVLATNALPGDALEHGPSETIPSTEAAIDQGAPATHPAISRPLSRTRGRMFLGPWNIGAIQANSDDVATQLGLIACHAAVDLIAASALKFSPWVVWSKLDGVVRPVAHGYCETKFGTQRRRREFQPPRNPF